MGIDKFNHEGYSDPTIYEAHINKTIEEGIAKFSRKSLTMQQSSILFVMVTQSVRTRPMPDISNSVKESRDKP